MSKEEFIQECSMRIIAAAVSGSGTVNCNDPIVINRTYNIAVALADKIYK